MNVLAFDTCFDACSVAAGRGLLSLSPAIAAFHESMSSGQAERLVPMISEALSATGMSVLDLDRIAVTRGPGTFTGTRIATAAARALALVANTPIVPVSTLHLMAMNPSLHVIGASELVIATDARRGEVYIERFDPRTLASRAPAAALAIDEAVQQLPERDVVAAGSGAEALAKAANATGRSIRAIEPHLLPDSVDVLFRAIHMRHFNSVQAVYLRPPDAKPQINAVIA
ncbi:MAG: tRNA (adenosine(37)-N6)-threonylcarbamoyltransferase complex dimerization subunit type 1 TsaB [Hyphomicrobium sp.]